MHHEQLQDLVQSYPVQSLGMSAAPSIVAVASSLALYQVVIGSVQKPSKSTGTKLPSVIKSICAGELILEARLGREVPQPGSPRRSRLKRAVALRVTT